LIFAKTFDHFWRLVLLNLFDPSLSFLRLDWWKLHFTLLSIRKNNFPVNLFFFSGRSKILNIIKCFLCEMKYFCFCPFTKPLELIFKELICSRKPTSRLQPLLIPITPHGWQVGWVFVKFVFLKQMASLKKKNRGLLFQPKSKESLSDLESDFFTNLRFACIFVRSTIYFSRQGNSGSSGGRGKVELSYLDEMTEWWRRLF